MSFGTVIARHPAEPLPELLDSLPDYALWQCVVISLKDSSYAPLRCLDCDVQDGIVELTGRVPSFFLKQMAQVLVLRLRDVKAVRNHVLVT